MAIPLLPNMILPNTRPTFYDCDSVTIQELAATLHGAMNNVINEYNKLETSVAEFMESTNANQEAFQIAIRQEFQDFIDIVDLTVKNMEKTVETTVQNAIENGVVSIVQEYDQNTESLSLVVTGGM